MMMFLGKLIAIYLGIGVVTLIGTIVFVAVMLTMDEVNKTKRLDGVLKKFASVFGESLGDFDLEEEAKNVDDVRPFWHSVIDIILRWPPVLFGFITALATKDE